jgi:hypothetical protein
VIEKTPRKPSLPATDLALRPGDFPVGFPQSRAAARAVLEKRRRPKHPPSFTLDLSAESIERCREIYAKLARTSPWEPISDGMPYIQILFPKDFTAGDEQAPVNGKQDGPDVGEQTGCQAASINRSLYEDISSDR